MATIVIDPTTGERVNRIQVDPITGERLESPQNLREKAKGYREEYENIKSAEEFLESGKYGTPEEFGRSKTNLKQGDNFLQRAGRDLGSALKFPMQYGPGRGLSKILFEGKNLYNRENLIQDIGQRSRDAEESANQTVLLRQLKGKPNPTAEEKEFIEESKFTNQIKQAGKDIIQNPGQFIKGMGQDVLEYGPYYAIGGQALKIPGLGKYTKNLSPAKKLIAGTVTEDIPAQALIDAPTAMNKGQNYGLKDVVSESILGAGFSGIKLSKSAKASKIRREKLMALKKKRDLEVIDYDRQGNPKNAPLPELQPIKQTNTYPDYTETTVREYKVEKADRPELEKLFKEKYKKEIGEDENLENYATELSYPELKEQVHRDIIPFNQYIREWLEFDFKRKYKENYDIADETLNKYATELNEEELKEQVENPVKYEDYKSVMDNYYKERELGDIEERKKQWETRWEGIAHADLIRHQLGLIKRFEGVTVGGKKGKEKVNRLGYAGEVYGESFKNADVVAQEMGYADESELMEAINNVPTYKEFLSGKPWPFKPLSRK